VPGAFQRGECDYSDQQRQIAASGVEPGVCSREDSMCARVFLTRETTVVRDASEDPRFANNPFVTGEIGSVRFYASVPLETASGFVLGSLCVFSDAPANPEPEQIAMLELLAQQTVELLELQHRTLQLNVALDEVRRSNAKLGEFAGRVSHDLRIPLTTILGYVELSEDDPDMPPEHPAAEYLQLIGASGRRMLAMLEDVLDYSKVGGALHPQPVSLRGAAADVARDLGIAVRSRSHAGLRRRAAARRSAPAARPAAEPALQRPELPQPGTSPGNPDQRGL
jgi:signal transduction histidine kinase